MDKDGEILKIVKNTKEIVTNNSKVINETSNHVREAKKLQEDFVPVFQAIALLPETMKELYRMQNDAFQESLRELLKAHREALKASTWPWVGKVITLLVVVILILVAAFVGFENLATIKEIVPRY